MLAADVAADVLGDTPNGRLHEALVASGKAAQVFSFTIAGRDPGFVLFGAVVKKGEPLEPVRQTMVDVIESFGKTPVTDAEVKRQFDVAFAFFRSGDLAGAVTAFNAFSRRYPASGYLDSVRFWLGNAYYGKREYKEAIAIFRAFITAAPDHSRVPEAMLAVANTQAEMKDSKSARATLAELLKRYPESEAAQAGKERLATLK